MVLIVVEEGERGGVKGQRLKRSDLLGRTRRRLNGKSTNSLKYVREYPVLYDLGNAEHLNSSVTRVLWEEIAEKLGESGTK